MLVEALAAQRAEEAARQIIHAVPGSDARPGVCDVSSLRDVRVFAERCLEDEPRLDVLVNNAGVMPDDRALSADGNELMFATHVLAPFALTALLSDLLRRSARRG